MSRPRPVFGEPLADILKAGEAVLSGKASGEWRHFGLAKDEEFDRRMIDDLERHDRGD